jgi:CRP/FNR family transcriptional regulator
VLSLILDDVASSASVVAPSKLDFDADAPVRSLARNEFLFEAGDLKTTLYRVEAGVLGVYTGRVGAEAEVVEYALAGDVVGMGFLERHAVTARAEVETKVRCFPLDALTDLAAQDERTQIRFDQAVRREFAFRRDSLAQSGRSRSIVRLAAFLAALVQQNVQEGRDPVLIDEAPNCSVVADYLGLSLDELEANLGELEKRGLIEPANHALRVTNLVGLESLSNEVSGGLLQSDLPGEPTYLLR